MDTMRILGVLYRERHDTTIFALEYGESGAEIRRETSLSEKCKWIWESSEYSTVTCRTCLFSFDVDVSAVRVNLSLPPEI